MALASTLSCRLQSVCREYLIIVGSIPNGAGTMVLWFCSFLRVDGSQVTLCIDYSERWPSSLDFSAEAYRINALH